MEESQKSVELGGLVIFHDPEGNPHEALVTTVWTPTMINLVYVSSDENRKDTYGRQIERATSVQHVSLTQVHGYYWRLPHEEPRPYQAPAQV